MDIYIEESRNFLAIKYGEGSSGDFSSAGLKRIQAFIFEGSIMDELVLDFKKINVLFNGRTCF
ncbi:hypothetical protein [Planococcus beigongshangi]|uniref:hypothetical protein n=1 Tax=Planococcus beigongshangi TaxID=2782536 RepID=UPI00193B3608|nr:hypothetical protein [Planococcus beigongshangi]